MKFYNLFALTILAAAFSCEKKDNAELFRFNGGAMKEQYTKGDKATLEILNPQGKTVDSIVYFVNGEKLGMVKGTNKFMFDLADTNFGYQQLKALVYFEGQNLEVTDRIEVISDVQADVLTYTVVNTYPHDVTSFTEGLEFYRDTLLESTGQKGQSYFRKYDYKTGKVFKQVDLEAQYFGEGITAIGGRIFQLTWQSGVGFIYNANTLKLEKTFKYDKPIEGWGMTNDGTHIYQTDGTEKIWKMDPATQKMVGNVNVYWAANKIKSLNEIEMIDGKIYGNIWQQDGIAVIDPATGAVTGVLDLSALRKELKSPTAEVLNGIAYNPKTKTIFVTGKNWDKLFEIKVSE
ncbi:Glutamine cyclotransferase [Flavobacterium longum]|uniref:glutaminyl-peptide cyclotransferase n=1 Tax=Flavobacterium longum TaxID=1299340 RepID=UPI0039EC48F1